MHRIHLAELAIRNPFFQNLADPPVDGLKVRLDQPVDVLGLAFSRPHHFALHQLGIDLIGGDEIKICSHVSHDLFPRRQFTVQRLENTRLHSGKRIVEHRAV